MELIFYLIGHLGLVVFLPVGLLVAIYVGSHATGFRNRSILGGTTFALCAALPLAWVAYSEYQQQAPYALSAQCNEMRKLDLALSPAEPLPTDGFLIAIDYDGMSNFRRIKNLPRHPGNDIINGSTFDQMAQIALLDWKYSYVEFEMKLRSKQDPMFPGEYSNAGQLDWRSWSGDRYRLYYLAPKGHPNCVQRLWADSLPTRSETSNPAGMQMPSTSEFCLALEITSTSIGRYRLVASDQFESEPWIFNIYGIPFYWFADTRSDTIEITDNGLTMPVAKYEGFQVLSNGKSVRSCRNKGAAGILKSTLKPDPTRGFYVAKSWYADSAVQRYYEPDRSVEAVVREPFAGNFAPYDPLAPVHYEGKRCPEFKDTVESKVAAWAKANEQRYRCARVSDIKVACDYLEDHRPRETWTYESCGRRNSSVNSTSYDPELHGGASLE